MRYAMRLNGVDGNPLVRLSHLGGMLKGGTQRVTSRLWGRPTQQRVVVSRPLLLDYQASRVAKRKSIGSWFVRGRTIHSYGVVFVRLIGTQRYLGR